MKLVNRHEDVLNHGDKVSVSVTHQLRINGDDSWVKIEATSSVRQEESGEQARDRVLDFINESAIKAAEQVAARVMEHN